MNTLQTDKKGNILFPNGDTFGKIKSPNKKGTKAPIKKASIKVGEYIIGTGEVKDLDGKVIGIYKDDVSTPTDPEEIDTSKMSKAELSRMLDQRREKEKEEYCMGKDSSLIVTGELGRMLYGTDNRKLNGVAEQKLAEANKKYGWKYPDWESLSKGELLSEEFLTTYESYVDWYGFLKAHPEFSCTEKFYRKQWKHLLIRTLGIV